MRNSLLVTLVLTLAVVVVLPASAQTPGGGGCNPYTQGSWAVRAPVPAPMVRPWGVFFPDNGNFYALGGRQTDVAGSDYLNPREYSPFSNVWTVKAAVFNNNQVNNMVAGVLNFNGAPPTDLIITVGGSAAGATTATSDVRQYNPMTDSLTVVATDPWPGNVGGTVLPGGAAVFGNKLYVFGGFNINVGMTSQIWQFDPNGAAGTRWSAGWRRSS